MKDRYDDDYAAKKSCSAVTVIKTVLILAAVAFVAYKIYTKYFKKVKPAPSPEDEDELLELTEEEASEILNAAN